MKKSHGRKIYRIQNYPYATQYFKVLWKFGASKVIKHKDGTYYFHLTVLQDIQNKKIEDASTFMGIDVGMNNRKGLLLRCESCNYEMNADLNDT